MILKVLGFSNYRVNYFEFHILLTAVLLLRNASAENNKFQYSITGYWCVVLSWFNRLLVLVKDVGYSQIEKN